MICTIHFIAESQQNLNIDKDTTLPVSARKVKTSGLKVRCPYILAGSFLAGSSTVS